MSHSAGDSSPDLGRKTHHDIQSRVWLCALMSAGTLALEGCASTTTTAVRPDQLPELSESAARHPRGWHDTTGADGERMTLKGPITMVEVHDKGPPPKSDVFVPPFHATLTNDQLSVRRGEQSLSYSLANVRRIDVTYSTTRQDTALGLIIGTVPFLLLGTGLLVYGV